MEVMQDIFEGLKRSYYTNFFSLLLIAKNDYNLSNSMF